MALTSCTHLSHALGQEDGFNLTESMKAVLVELIRLLSIVLNLSLKLEIDVTTT